MKFTREQIEQTIKQMTNYKWFEKGDYNLNIVGIRNSDTKNKVTNAFDDKITLSYKIGTDKEGKGGEWQFHCFDCTTDPGTHWVENIMRKEGVAILKPGQYRSSHKIRKHQGRYEALGQQKPVKVYRDNNRDGWYNLNEDSVQEGLFGINIHRATKHAGKKSTQIDKWSAGCQVIASNDDWKLFMKICRKARDTWSNNFTYTLLESDKVLKTWL
mgnify:FL=1|tara:strand:+ start:190 stop:831 length:642 start_codon:yes stop_codon:yes gene_type:complete